MFSVKPILYQSILVLRFFSQQKINNIFACLVGAVIFWSGYVLMGIGKATALIQELCSCEMSSLFLNGEDFGEFSESRLPIISTSSSRQSGWAHAELHAVMVWLLSVSDIASLLDLATWWVRGLIKRTWGLSVCLSVSLLPFLAMKSEDDAEGHQKLFASVWVLNQNTSADGVLLMMLFWIKHQKHQTSASNKEPTVLFVEQGTELPVLVPAVYGIFHFAHRWVLLLCWAAATIKDVFPVTSKFIIACVRWGRRRASGVKRLC